MLHFRSYRVHHVVSNQHRDRRRRGPSERRPLQGTVIVTLAVTRTVAFCPGIIGLSPISAVGK
jgi:hypothetical protein